MGRNQKVTSQKVTNQPSQKVMLQLLKPSSRKDPVPEERTKMEVMTKKVVTSQRSQKAEVTNQKVTNQKVTNQPSQKEMLQLPNLSLESERDLDLEEKTKKEEMTKKVVISQRSQRVINQKVTNQRVRNQPNLLLNSEEDTPTE